MIVRVGILLVKVYEIVGTLNFVISVCKALKGLTDAFYGCGKVKKT